MAENGQGDHTIRFTVAGIPKAMQVSGARRVPLASGKVAHLPTKRNGEWALLVGQIGREHAPEIPWTGPVSFTALFYLPRPQAVTRKKPSAPVRRPDLDNLLHKLTDQFSGVFYADDSQIVDLIAQKRYAWEDRAPGVEIIVTQLAVPLPVTF